MKKLEISIDRKSDCTIMIGSDVPSNMSKTIDPNKWTSIHIIYDPAVTQLANTIAAQYDTDYLIPVDNPEDNKTFVGLEKICSQLSAQRADRGSLVVNVGGGALCDLGGFSASIYMRGIPFANIPTTLLSQVDASIGGKTGINAFDIKNLIGTIAQPTHVIIDPQILKKLPRKHIASGFAEILKHGLIADREYWQQLAGLNADEITQNPVLFSSIIYRSNQIKHAIVVSDEREDNNRKKLNFGHTVGHAIESLSHDTDTPFLHGEAIAIGMVVEAELSDLSNSDKKSIKTVLQKYYLPTTIPRSFVAHKILEKMKSDKKNKAGKIRLTLLDKIGSAVINQQCKDNDIYKALKRSYQ